MTYLVVGGCEVASDFGFLEALVEVALVGEEEMKVDGLLERSESESFILALWSGHQMRAAGTKTVAGQCVGKRLGGDWTDAERLDPDLLNPITSSDLGAPGQSQVELEVDE